MGAYVVSTAKSIRHTYDVRICSRRDFGENGTKKSVFHRKQNYDLLALSQKYRDNDDFETFVSYLFVATIYAAVSFCTYCISPRLKYRFIIINDLCVGKLSFFRD